MTWKHFTESEFASSDDPSSGALIDHSLVDTLDIIREECGFPFHINSGVRTPSHNAEVGGKTESEHLTGNAVDISVSDSRQRFLIVQSAIKHGINRIGVAKSFVHLGNSPNHPQDVLWTY